MILSGLKFQTLKTLKMEEGKRKMGNGKWKIEKGKRKTEAVTRQNTTYKIK